MSMMNTGVKSGLRRKFAVVAGATALLLGGGIAAASSAAAGPSCPSGYHCVFEGSIGTSAHNYFNSDADFRDDAFYPSGATVNDNSWSASNSSNSGYESHYYRDPGYQNFNFCVNPGSYVTHDRLTDDFVDGNGVGQRDESTSLLLRPTTSVSCF
ncbi:peptidase inhibitor family I36 protein [Streptomyces sp. NPDC127092]|uniref:peptidase inhibitor family I36 protein n=1 Tax=Streptomyces sp. NPDC127092 TaxID=3347135 RepID=UPI00365CE924